MARVIRRTGEPRRVPGEAYDALSDARERLARATSDAETLRATASREADEIRANARAEGLRSATDEAARLVARAQATYDAAISAAEVDVRHVLRVALERAIRTELAEEPAHIRRIATELLERAKHAKAMRVRVHPEDVPMLTGLLDSLPPAAHARIEADASIERGGCVLSSELGELDARVATQIERLRAILEEAR